MEPVQADMLSRMLHEFRRAFRSLQRDRTFAIAGVVILALGIGANTAIFSVVNGVLLRSLPIRNPGAVVFVSASNAERRLSGGGVSVAAYETFRDGAATLQSIAAYCAEDFSLTGSGDPESIAGARVAPNFFDVLGVRAMMGRAFQPQEGSEGAPPVAMISHSLWTRRFSGDRSILGKPLVLNQEAYTIIGVAPPDFPFPLPGTDVWVSRIMKFGGFQPEQIRAGAGFLTSFARLKPGVSTAQAEAELAVLAQHYRQANPNAPDADPHRHIDAVPLQESLVAGIRRTLLILMGAVGLVLLIACANVASLMLARATGRAKEIAIRAALGAGRATLVRQLLAESLLLAGSGAILGALLARWCVTLLVKIDAGNNLPGFQPALDLHVLAFTIGISVLSGILFGLAPAVQFSRPDLNSVLRDGGRGNTGGAHRRRTRGNLVAAQMALSVVLLIGAALLLQSFRNLQNVNLGFDPHQTLTMNVSLPPAKYQDGPHRAQFFRDVVQRVAGLPGVTSAVASVSRPMGLFVMTPLLADGQPLVPFGQRPVAIWNGATPGYFQTFGIPMLRGRDFSWTDDENAPRVVIVSQSLANRFWPNQNPLGKHLTFTRQQVAFEIVGVAGDTRTNGLQSDPGMVVFTPYAQWTFPAMTVSLRTQGAPTLFGKAAPAQVQALDRDQPVTGVKTVDELMDTSLARSRETMYLVGGFAGVSLFLALIGLYGSMAYSVAQRTVEIGIRQAVGAQRSDILRLVVFQGIRLALLGTAAGVVAAMWVTRWLSAILFHVEATDPLVFAAVAALFLMVAAAASLVPALQATRVDPLTALRSS